MLNPFENSLFYLFSQGIATGWGATKGYYIKLLIVFRERNLYFEFDPNYLQALRVERVQNEFINLNHVQCDCSMLQSLATFQ